MIAVPSTCTCCTLTRQVMPAFPYMYLHAALCQRTRDGRHPGGSMEPPFLSSMYRENPLPSWTAKVSWYYVLTSVIGRILVVYLPSSATGYSEHTIFDREWDAKAGVVSNFWCALRAFSFFQTPLSKFLDLPLNTTLSWRKRYMCVYFRVVQEYFTVVWKLFTQQKIHNLLYTICYGQWQWRTSCYLNLRSRLIVS